MRFTFIQSSGIKGRTFAHKLAPVTVITGDIGTGKTAISSAIRLALLGYLPELGKRPADTWLLSKGGHPLMTELAWDGGYVYRDWKLVSGVVKSEVKGTVLAVPPVLFDAREFFGLTAKQRNEALVSLVADGTVTADQIEKNLNGMAGEVMQYAGLPEHGFFANATAKLEASVKAIGDEVKADKALCATSTSETVPALGPVEKELGEARAIVECLLLSLNDESKRGEMARKIEQFNDTIEAQGQELDEAEGAEQPSSEPQLACPTCGTTGKAWQAVRDLRRIQGQAEAKKRIEARRVALDKLKAQRDELAETLAGLPNEATDAAQKITGVRARVTELSAKRDEILRGQERRKHWLAAADRLARNEVALVGLKAAVKALQGWMAETITARSTEFMQGASTIIGKMMGRTLTMRDGVIGYMDGPDWVSQYTFSGSEQYLAYAGFALALATKSPVRLAIFEEMAHLGDTSKFVRIAAELVRDGYLEQFIGVCPRVDMAELKDLDIEHIEVK
jgi:hypothetical protein